MRPILYGILGAGIASVVLVTAVVLIQEREIPEEIAAKVAQEWTADTIDSIADAIAKQVTGGVPGLNEIASGVISGQIRQRIAWEYSDPQCMAEDRCEVIATASAPIEVGVLAFQLKYTVSVDFRLMVDTKKRLVDDWSLVLSSFKFSKGQ